MSNDATPSAESWISAYAQALGLEPPSAAELEQLLALAGVAAHASQRQAAPVSTWLAARAGLSPAAALDRARELAREFEQAEDAASELG